MARVAKLKGELRVGKSATVEMFSGITYTGHVSGQYFGKTTTNGREIPARRTRHQIIVSELN